MWDDGNLKETAAGKENDNSKAEQTTNFSGFNSTCRQFDSNV